MALNCRGNYQMCWWSLSGSFVSFIWFLRYRSEMFIYIGKTLQFWFIYKDWIYQVYILIRNKWHHHLSVKVVWTDLLIFRNNPIYATFTQVSVSESPSENFVRSRNYLKGEGSGFLLHHPHLLSKTNESNDI